LTEEVVIRRSGKAITVEPPDVDLLWDAWISLMETGDYVRKTKRHPESARERDRYYVCAGDSDEEPMDWTAWESRCVSCGTVTGGKASRCRKCGGNSFSVSKKTT